MNKINIYVLTFFLSLAGVSIYAQNNRSQVVITSGQDNNVFFHTIERGQTVYAIATMYGVTPDDIYRLNPDSKEGIKAGATLKIPQRDIVGGTAKKQDGNYIFHTIQPKETLYSLSIRYTVPATAIVKANPGLSTSTFTIGKTIRIPATQVEDLPTTERSDRFPLIAAETTHYKVTHSITFSVGAPPCGSKASPLNTDQSAPPLDSGRFAAR